jgi:hypothetical protein
VNLLVSVDVEADGPCPGLYSMVSFGAVVVERSLDRTFYGRTAPLPGAMFFEEALAVSRTTREQHLRMEWPAETMANFHRWLTGLGADRLTLVSDNPAFDAPWINYYFHYCAQMLLALNGKGFKPVNPFGHSARRIGDIWSGLRRKLNDHSSWKDLRKTRHTHHPVDDARGNAEALLEIERRMEEARR